MGGGEQRSAKLAFKAAEEEAQRCADLEAEQEDEQEQEEEAAWEAEAQAKEAEERAAVKRNREMRAQAKADAAAKKKAKADSAALWAAVDQATSSEPAPVPAAAAAAAVAPAPEPAPEPAVAPAGTAVLADAGSGGEGEDDEPFEYPPRRASGGASSSLSKHRIAQLDADMAAFEAAEKVKAKAYAFLDSDVSEGDEEDDEGDNEVLMVPRAAGVAQLPPRGALAAPLVAAPPSTSAAAAGTFRALDRLGSCGDHRSHARTRGNERRERCC